MRLAEGTHLASRSSSSSAHMSDWPSVMEGCHEGALWLILTETVLAASSGNRSTVRPGEEALPSALQAELSASSPKALPWA